MRPLLIFERAWKGLLLSMFCYTSIAAQPTEMLADISPNKILAMGRNAHRMGDYYSAESCYARYLDFKPKKNNVRWTLAEIQGQLRDYDSALENYAIIANSDAQRYPLVKFKIAGILMRLGEYDHAKNLYGDFITSYKDHKDFKEYRNLTKMKIAGCDSALLFLEEPKNAILYKLGNEVNNPHTDAAPFLMNDELYFSSLRQDGLHFYHIDSIKPRRKFYKVTGSGPAVEWNIPGVPEQVDLSSATLNKTQDRLYFSQCILDWKNNHICNLYRSDLKKGNIWSEPIELNQVNAKGYSSSMPTASLGADKGKEILYFVSNRPEGQGGMDIWYTVYDEKKDSYREPKNLGKRINSAQDDISPYYDDIERKLYFSSDGWSGLGGFDIFSSRGEQRKFGPRSNLGSPINTGFDEVAYILSGNRKSGYLVSNRSKVNQLTHPYCCDDIYSFEYPDKVILGVGGYVLEVDKELYFQGRGEELDGMASLDSSPIPGALASLFLIEDGEEVMIDQKRTNHEGFYYFDLEPEMAYRVEVSNEGFLHNNIGLSTVGRTSSDTLFFNMGLSTISLDDIVIENIHFETNSDELDKDSWLIIDRSILSVLMENPEYGLKISAHTDNVGAEAYNQDLSQRRANTLQRYLIDKGIHASRLDSKGFGELRPLVANEHPDGTDNPKAREQNRRIEVQLILPTTK